MAKIEGELTPHILWAKHTYSNIVFDYINLTSNIEVSINTIITIHFIKTDGLANQFVSVVLAKLPFKSKHDMLCKILKQTYSMLIDIYSKEIAEALTFYEFRNTLSHSQLSSNTKHILEAKTKQRIAFVNHNNSTSQPIFITLKKHEEDISRLLKVIEAFEFIYTHICTCVNPKEMNEIYFENKNKGA